MPSHSHRSRKAEAHRNFAAQIKKIQKTRHKIRAQEIHIRNDNDDSNLKLVRFHLLNANTDIKNTNNDNFNGTKLKLI